MQMKKLPVLFLMVFIATVSKAQNWAPIGAKWTYEIRNPFGPEKNFQVWTVVKDTFVNGKTCRLIKKTGFAAKGEPDLITYEDSGVVYCFRDEKFSVLYDFTKEKGESWTLEKDTCSLAVVVDSTAMQTINGKTLKVQYIRGNKIIENIGHILGEFDFHCSGPISDGPYIYGLRCYQDSVIGFYSTGLAPSCEYVVGIQETHKTSEIQLFPNPASDKLFIQTKFTNALNYHIYNAAGQIVASGKTSPDFTSVNINALKNGFYIFELVSASEKQQQCFIIKK
jgi:hypothetical protein